MSKFLFPVLAASALLLNGCVAKAAWDVATLPVKAGSKAVDWTTTSRSEADRNYGKKARKQAEKDCRKDKSKCGNEYGERDDRD
jgi:hypothetical protein